LNLSVIKIFKNFEHTHTSEVTYIPTTTTPNPISFLQLSFNYKLKLYLHLSDEFLRPRIQSTRVGVEDVNTPATTAYRRTTPERSCHSKDKCVSSC